MKRKKFYFIVWQSADRILCGRRGVCFSIVTLINHNLLMACF